MPRRKKGARKGRRNNNSSSVVSDKISIVARLFSASVLSGGAGTISMMPVTFPTASALADSYEFYRIKFLRYRLHPGEAAAFTGPIGVCYIPGVTDNPPTTTAGIANIDNHLILTNRQVSPTKWVKVTGAKLSSYMTWYKTVAGTPDSDVEIQGVLYLSGVTTDHYDIEVEAIFEFKTLVPIGSTPEARRQRAILAEKERLLKILSYSPAVLNKVGSSPIPTGSVPGAM